MPIKRIMTVSLETVHSCVSSAKRTRSGSHFESYKSCVLRLTSTTEKIYVTLRYHKYLKIASTLQDDNGIPVMNSI